MFNVPIGTGDGRPFVFWKEVTAILFIGCKESQWIIAN